MRRKNVVIVPAKCQHTGKMCGIRTERRNNGWHMNWAFELLEEEAVRCLYAIVLYEYTFEKQMGYINNII